MVAYATTQNPKPPKIATVYRNYAAIVPADGTAIGPFEGIYVGGAGDVKVARMDGTLVIFKAVPVGTFLPIEVQGVEATGTTATLLIGLG